MMFMSNYKVSLGSEITDIIWNITCGEESSLSIDLFEEDGITPLNSDGWVFVTTIYNKPDHMFFELPFTLVDGVLTSTVSPSDTAIFPRPDNETLKTLPFEVIGYKEGLNLYGEEYSMHSWYAAKGNVKAFSTLNN